MRTSLRHCRAVALSTLLVGSIVGVAVGQTAGPGGALNFPGTTSYVQVTNGTWFSNNFTIEGWVFVRSYNSWSRLLDFANGINNNNVYLALSAGVSGFPAMGVFINTGTPVLQANTRLPLNQWAHLAATLNGTTGTIYINGNPVGSGTLNVPPAVLRTNNYIGRSFNGADAFPNAVFDEVRIWSTARTPAQIKADMGRSLGGIQPGLKGYWRFDEGTGTLVADSTGNGNSATLQGGVTRTNSTAPISAPMTVPGSALNCNGVTDCATAPAGVWFNGDFTVEAWVYPRDYHPYAGLIDFGNGPGEDNVFISLSAPVQNGGSLPMLQIYSGGNGFPLVLGANPLPLNQWSHLAVTLAGGYGTIYVNGSVAGAYGPIQIPANVLRTNNFIGRSSWGDSFANATIDDLRIWNVARSQPQILAGMHRTLTGTENGLTGYWRFDEAVGTTAADTTDQGNALALSGANWTNSTAPIAAGPGSGLNFNGTNQYATVPHQPALDAYPITVMTWFKTTNGVGSASLINKYVSSSFNGYHLFTVDGRLRAWYIRDAANNVYNGGPLDAGLVNDGQWHHAAMVIDASGGSLYLDGILKSTLGWTGAAGPVTTAQPLDFGIYPGNSLWSGQLDEVSIWNAALSPGQIRACMNNGLMGTETNLLGYWPLDEGSGTTTSDRSTNGNQATLYGTPAWLTSPVPVVVSEPGYALNLNGVNSHLQAANDVWFNGNFTVEGWVYVRSYNNWSRLIDFANGGYVHNVYLALSEGTSGYPKMGIFDLANAPLVGSTNQLPLNQWVHLAATYDGTNGTIYINGTVTGYGPLPVAPPNVLRTNNYIGRSNFGGDGYANAIFDEVRIWNVARTASQIQTEMKRSLSGNEAGLVGYWRFDEGVGTNTVDATGAGHVATLVNSPTWQMSSAPLNPGLPTVTTLAASSIAPNSATLNGNVISGRAAATAWFDYGTTTNYNSHTPVTNVGNFAASISANLTGLLSGAPYHYRAVATNSAGTNFGLDQTFTTGLGTNANLAGLTLSAGALSPVFNGGIFSYTASITNGTATTFFLVATRAENGATLQLSVNGGAFFPINSGSSSGALPLMVGTNILDIKVTSGDGVSVQDYVVSLKRSLYAPVVTTLPATAISSNVATLNATVSPSNSPTSLYFEWGTTIGYGNFTSTQSVSSSVLYANLNQPLTGLTAGATYHFRGVATNAGGIVFGADQAFRMVGTYIVTNLADNGAVGTLRAYLASAIAGDTFIITNSGTINLFYATLAINTNVNIIGPGANLAAISGNNSYRVFTIAAGVTASISGLTIQNGVAPYGANGTQGPQGPNGYYYYCGLPTNCYACPGNGYTGNSGAIGQYGGGIYNSGTLRLTACYIYNNRAGSGGNGGQGGYPGIDYVGGCSMRSGDGGVGGQGGYGGGIFSSGTLIMNDCTVAQNYSGQGGYGGSGWAYGANGPYGQGAGLAVGGNCTFTNCTIYGNNSGSGTGGGIYNFGTLTLVACTVSANRSGSAGGIYNDGTATLRSTIVGNDIYYSSSALISDLSGSFISQGHNLVTCNNGSSGINQASDFTGTLAAPRDAGLNFLSYNGGTVPTAVPFYGSPFYYAAIDGGDNALLAVLPRDQRGRPRQSGYAVDIGAVEVDYNRGFNNVLVSPIGPTNVTFNFNLDTGGSASTNYVEFGTTTNYGSYSASNTVAGGVVGYQPKSIPVNGLQPGTLYHYRVVALNVSDRYNTSDFTFTTKSTNATLSNLALSAGDLTPAFDPQTTNYDALAPENVSSVTVTPTVAQANAVVRVRVNNGTYTFVTSGSASGALPLRVGTNLVRINVTAQDGVTSMTYGIAVVWSPVIPPPYLNSQIFLSSGAFQFSFTNIPGAPFTVVASPDVSLPLTNWTVLGSVTDSPDGYFQFIDLDATNFPTRFYQLRSP